MRVTFFEVISRFFNKKRLGKYFYIPSISVNISYVNKVLAKSEVNCQDCSKRKKKSFQNKSFSNLTNKSTCQVKVCLGKPFHFHIESI